MEASKGNEIGNEISNWNLVQNKYTDELAKLYVEYGVDIPEEAYKLLNRKVEAFRDELTRKGIK